MRDTKKVTVPIPSPNKRFNRNLEAFLFREIS